LIDFISKLTRGVKFEQFTAEEQQLVTSFDLKKYIRQKAGLYSFEKKYVAGRLDVNKSGVGFLELTRNKRDMLIEAGDLSGARRGDIVIAKKIFGKSRPKAAVVHILYKKSSTIVVYTQAMGGKIGGIELKSGLPISITSSQKSLKPLPPRTVLKINRDTLGVEEVLGVLDDPKVDEKISLALFNKKEPFSNEAHMEAGAYGDSVDRSLYPHRTDLTHLPFCTIDPVTAKDFDDAIYFDKEKVILYVAIADVSEYVHAFTQLDKEAKERGFTIYFPHKSIPMLPRILSENICSLKPNEDRLAYVAKITLDPLTLEPLKEEFIKAVIHSRKRYTYEEVDCYLAGDFSAKKEQESAILDYLLPLNELTQKLRSKRFKVGYNFRSKDRKLYLDEEQRLQRVGVEEETPSHSLIEDCMLLANQAAAKVFNYGVYRIHPAPSPERIISLLDDLAVLGIFVKRHNDLHRMITEIQARADDLELREEVDTLIIKAQKRAEYASKDEGHFGLGFEHYTHFTSPIRRYSDLVVHRLIKAMSEEDKKQFNYLTTGIDTVCQKISNLERESDKVAWDLEDRKFARWAKEQIGAVFSAKIVSVDTAAVAELLGDFYGARIVLPKEYDLELYEQVDVKITQVDIAEPKIIGRVV
jgi:ribonuclease R